MPVALFYNYPVLSDTLIGQISQETVPNKILTEGSVTYLFKDDELIGFNIFNFSKVAKIWANGPVRLYSTTFFHLIRTLLNPTYIKDSLFPSDSGFIIGEVTEVQSNSSYLITITNDIFHAYSEGDHFKLQEKVVFINKRIYNDEGFLIEKIIPSTYDGLICKIDEGMNELDIGTDLYYIKEVK